MEPITVESEPLVKHMGLFYEFIDANGFGYNFSHALDLGVNYKVPYYTERQYLVLGTDVSFHIGMFQWI